MPRQKSNIHYLYKTTCIITSRYYIGMHSTYNLNDGYMGSVKRLRRSIRKYGESNHKKEILEFFDCRDLLIEAEKKAITPDMITDKNCMNLKEGGQGGFSSEEHRRKFMETVSFEASHKKIKELRLSDNDWCIKLSNNIKEGHKRIKFNFKTFKGKTHSDETKKMISDKLKNKQLGESNSQFGTCWITKDGLNKKVNRKILHEWLNNGWLKGRN